MAVKAHKLGPGSLKLGATGSEIEFAIALRSCEVEPDVDEGELVPVLSGDEIDEGDEETYNLTGSLVESYDLDSLQVWAHVNAGTVVPFLFRPDNDKAVGIKGEVKVRRIGWGGDVKERNEKDFEFPGRNGMYQLVDELGSIITSYTPATGTAPTPREDSTEEWN